MLSLIELDNDILRHFLAFSFVAYNSPSAVVIVDNANATGGTQSVAVGFQASVTASSALALGSLMANSIANTTLIGTNGQDHIRASGTCAHVAKCMGNPYYTGDVGAGARLIANVEVSPDGISYTSAVTGGGDAWTFPSAASIIGLYNAAKVNDAYYWTVVNLDGADSILIVAGFAFGGPGTPDVIAPRTAHVFRVQFTNVSLGTEALTVTKMYTIPGLC